MKLPEIFTIYKIFDILNVPKYNQSACNSYLAQLKLTWLVDFEKPNIGIDQHFRWQI